MVIGKNMGIHLINKKEVHSMNLSWSELLFIFHTQLDYWEY